MGSKFEDRLGVGEPCSAQRVLAAAVRSPSGGGGGGAGLATLSPTGEWRDADPTLAALLGRTTAELCTTTLQAITHPTDAREDDTELERIRRGETRGYHLEKRVRDRNGDELWVSQLVWASVDARGSPTELACQLAPIVGTRRAEDAVVDRLATEQQVAVEMRLAADRMEALGTLAAGVAHEINNPLTYLLANLEHVIRRLRVLAASDDPLEELARNGGAISGYVQPLGHALDGASRVRLVVQSLMTFSQGSLEHRGLVEVRGVVESAIQLAWHEVRLRARLTKNLGEIPPVEANEARLAQVFLSLLVNAARAIPEGRASAEVRVTTRLDEAGDVVVEVMDTGVGIAPDVLPRIFDPFFTTGNGMGLGLSIAHGVVKSLGGDLKAFSTVGEGSVFRVTLPAARRYRDRTSSAQIRAVTPKRRVLVVDEEPLVRDAIAQAVSEQADVTGVSGAREALELLAVNEPFDLVLCELMMPTMTGMDFYAEVLRTAPRLAGRIAFMTGSVLTPRGRAFVESISNTCLEKPIDLQKLRRLVTHA